MNKTKLTDTEKSDIVELLEAIEIASNEEIDSSLESYGSMIVNSYVHGLITPSQKQKLKEYRIWKDGKGKPIEDEEKVNRMISLEGSGYFEPLCIYQHGLIEGRIVVASIEEYMEGKEEKKRANGGKYNIIEIYKSKHPRAYEYAKKNFQIVQKII